MDGVGGRGRRPRLPRRLAGRRLGVAGARGEHVHPSTTTPTSGSVAPSGETATAGGTVFASCDGAVATLASAPAPGWWVDDSSDQGQVEFRNGTQKVEVRAVCVDGGPQFTVEGPRADDRGGGPTSSTSPVPAPRRPRPTTTVVTARTTGPATTPRGAAAGEADRTAEGRRRKRVIAPAWETFPVLLRMSTLFLRTLRDDPADAEVPSHRLLVRAGYIRRAAPGGFTWLPLGFRVFRNVERVVREEMDAMGAQEVHFPALLPREPYEATGRWTEYGPNLFRLQDRRGNDFLLGPTHEEMFTLLVKELYSSYKDLPLSLYQIQTKFRDEARPRAGLIRGREFTMKDSYSFDVDDAGLDRSYAAHRDAYIRIFDRLGPRVRDRLGDVRGDGRLEERGVPAPDGDR